MENLKSQLQDNLKEALKKGDQTALSVLRMLLASIQNKEKEKRFKMSKTGQNFAEAELTEKSALASEEIIEVIFSEVKKRKDAATLYEKGNRQELADKEKKEIEVLQKYLPEQIPEDEVRKIVKEAIEKTGAKEMKDTGKIMAEVMPKVKGKAEGSLISKIVKELLSQK